MFCLILYLAILTVLDKLYAHLEQVRSNSSARVMFFYFSSAFNTIQPHVLIQKLLDHCDVPKSLLSWMLNYLTNRSQYVKINAAGTQSSLIYSNTGAPQGTVLAPFLFSLYTSKCRSSEMSCP